MKIYSAQLYCRTEEEGCGFESHEQIIWAMKDLGFENFCMDNERADVLWCGTQSYEDALNEYLSHEGVITREKIRKPSLEEKWPLVVTIFFEYDGRFGTDKQGFVKLFEILLNIFPVPECFIDINTIQESDNEEFTNCMDENYYYANGIINLPHLTMRSHLLFIRSYISHETNGHALFR